MSWPSVSRSWTEPLQFCPCDSSCRFGREFCVSGDRAPHSGMHKTQRFFAIVNPAAGGGRSAKLAGPALARLRQSNLQVDSVRSEEHRLNSSHVEISYAVFCLKKKI